MARRLGIEIAPGACRVVEVDARGGDESTVVRSMMRASWPNPSALADYRGRHASLVVWGLRAEHRQAVVTAGAYQEMRREAVSAAREAGADTRKMLADIAVAGAERSRRRPVMVALARTSDVAAALRPFVSAGVRVRSVVTPGLAMMSLSRMRRRLTPPGTAEAYVALEETSTAIALIRDAVLVAARELEWGYQDGTRVRSREEVSSRLGGAVETFFGDCGVRRSMVSQVCVCGGMPELRSMTLALMERLDVEVEPLDSLFGIDGDRLPDPSDDFPDRIAEMRVAWAVAADWEAPINFMRERRRLATKTLLTRAAVVAGVATGVTAAWGIAASGWLAPASGVVATEPRARAELPAAAPSLVLTPRAQADPAVVAVPALAPAIPARANEETVAPLVLTPVTPKPMPAAVAARPQPKRPERSAATNQGAVDDVHEPFDAELGTILYGGDRKLAIVDGRIVQVGDDVRGAKVIEIRPNEVLLRDTRGRLRQLVMRDRRTREK